MQRAIPGLWTGIWTASGGVSESCSLINVRDHWVASYGSPQSSPESIFYTVPFVPAIHVIVLSFSSKVPHMVLSNRYSLYNMGL